MHPQINMANNNNKKSFKMEAFRFEVQFKR